MFQAGPFHTFAITDGIGGELVYQVTNYAALVEYLDGQGYDIPESLFPDEDQVDAAAYALGFTDHPIVPKVDAVFDTFGALAWPHVFQPVKLVEDTPDYEKLCETLADGRNVNPLMRAFRDLSFDQTYQDEAGNVWDISDGKINLVRCAKCNAQNKDFPYEPGVRRHNVNSVRPTMRSSDIVAKLEAGINQHKSKNPHVRLALTGDAFVEITEGAGVERLRVVKVTAEDHGYPLPEPGNTTITILLDMDDDAAKAATLEAEKAEANKRGENVEYVQSGKWRFAVDLSGDMVPPGYDLQAWREQVFNPYPDRKAVDFGQGVKVVYEEAVDDDDQGASKFSAAEIGKVYRTGDKRDQGLELGEGVGCFMRHTLAGETVDIEIKTEGRTWFMVGVKLAGRSME